MNRYQAALARYWRRACAEHYTKDTQFFLFEPDGTFRVDRAAFELATAHRGLHGFAGALQEAQKGFIIHRNDGTVYEYKLK